MPNSKYTLQQMEGKGEERAGRERVSERVCESERRTDRILKCIL